MTWPLAANLRDAIAHPGDPYLTTWIMDWVWHAATHAPSQLFHANIFAPLQYTLAFTENLIGIVIVLAPLFAAGAPPLLINNVAILLGFLGAGYGAALLVRHLTNNIGAAIVAGTFFAFVPWRFSHLTHMHHLWTLWLPVLFLCLLRLRERPTIGRAIALTAVFVINGLTNMHWLAFGLAAVAWAIVLLFEKRFALYAGIAIVAGLVILAPLLQQYRIASRMYGLRGDATETSWYSSKPADWLIASLHNRLYGPLTNDGTVDPERWAFPGVLAIVLALITCVGAFRRKREPMQFLDRLLLVLTIAFLFVPVLAMITGSLGLARRLRHEPALLLGIYLTILGFIGSLGLNSQFGRLLFATPLFHGIRAPARWAMIAYLGLAILIGLAVRHRIVAAVLTVLFLIELRAAPIRYYLTTGEIPPAYTWNNVEPILALPMDQHHVYAYMDYATAHHLKMIDGVAGSKPVSYRRLETLPFVELVRQSGAKTVILDDQYVFTLDGRSQTFPPYPAHLLKPVHWQHVNGPLEIEGTAPRAREIRAWFDNRRVFTRLPSFHSIIAQRPDEIRMDTDLQIEIIDSQGRSHWLPQVWLRWTRIGERAPAHPLPQTGDLGAYR